MRISKRLCSTIAVGFSAASTTAESTTMSSNGSLWEPLNTVQITSQRRYSSFSGVCAKDESVMHAEIAKDAADALADHQSQSSNTVDHLETVNGSEENQLRISFNTNVVNLSHQFDSRLKTHVNGLSPEEIAQMEATDAVQLVSQYVFMHDTAHSLNRRFIPFNNLVNLHPLQEAALFGAAFRAIEEDKVPIDVAAKILRPSYHCERFSSYRGKALPLVRGKIAQAILNGTLTPIMCRKVMLSAGKNIGKDARIVGNLAKKAIGDDITTLLPETVIRLMFVICETTVKPPSELWSYCLRYIVSTMRKPRGEVLARVNEGRKKSTAEVIDGTKIEEDHELMSGIYENQSDNYTDSKDSALTEANQASQIHEIGHVMSTNVKPDPVNSDDKELLSKPYGLSVRQCYRILDVCSKIGVYTDINMLSQIVEEAWKNIAINASKCDFSKSSTSSDPLTSREVIHRLKRVVNLSPYDFFCLIKFSASLGTHFNAGQGAITDGVLIPLVPFLTDQNLLELMDTLVMSKNRYPPVFQSIIDRLVQTNKQHTNNPVLILHTQRLLRLLSREDELCGQLRLANFFDLLEDVCKHKKVLRTSQMARIVEDIYFISRRFARTAPIVIRLRALVDSFAEVLIKHLDVGLVSVDQVNRVLEIAIMMGMKPSKKITDGKAEGSTEYKNLETLRERRKELYRDVEPGQFPTTYRHRVSQISRILFQEMVYINQRTMIFNLPVDKSRLASFFECMVRAGPLNVIIACNMHRSLYDTHVPMCPVLIKLITNFLSKSLRHISVGADIKMVSEALGTKNQRPAKAQDVLTLIHCAKKNTIPGIGGHKFYVDFLEAAATVVNLDSILDDILPMKTHAL